MGPSGSGKTTLLTLMAGLLRPTAGEVLLFGSNLEAFSPRALQQLRAQRLGFVFQTFHLIDALSVLDNVVLALRFAGVARGQARRRATEVLQSVRIDHLAKRFPAQLSQGEKQRVAVARAIANSADLILADEPTASLETTQGFEVIQLLHTYAKLQQACVIVTSHDLRLQAHADRIIRLEDGRMVQ
jgi:putative ABC transport system ATP-binding protein